MFAFLHHPRLGYHLLRLSVAAMILLHGVGKITRGVAGIEGMLASKGLPPLLAYGVYVGEVVAPLLVIANIWVAPAALLMAVNMIFAIVLAHSGEVLALKRGGAWAIELQALFLIGSLCTALLARPGTRG